MPGEIPGHPKRDLHIGGKGLHRVRVISVIGTRICILAAEHVVDGRAAIRGGDYPIRRDGLAARQLHTDRRVVFDENFLDFGSETEARAKLIEPCQNQSNDGLRPADGIARIGLTHPSEG